MKIPAWAWTLVGLMIVAVIYFGATWLIDATDRAAREARNARAAEAQSVALSGIIRELGNRRAVERLAFEREVKAKDGAVEAWRRRAGAELAAKARIRLERDSVQAVLARRESVTGQSVVFEMDSAGVTAEVEIAPPPIPETEVTLSLAFKPTDVLIAFARDSLNQAILLAIADSLHRVDIPDVPELEIKPSRGPLFGIRLKGLVKTGAVFVAGGVTCLFFCPN